MRKVVFIAVICAATMAISCGETGPVQAPNPGAGRPVTLAPGRLVVFVHWGDQGIPDKRVELVELQRVLTTDESGLAEFFAPTGDYTLRAYDITRGRRSNISISRSPLSTAKKHGWKSSIASHATDESGPLMRHDGKASEKPTKGSVRQM